MKSSVYLIKKQSQLSLRFSNPLTEAVCSFPHKERHLSFPLTALIGQRSGYQGFPCSWRTIKQTAPKDKRQYDNNEVFNWYWNPTEAWGNIREEIGQTQTKNPET